MNKYNTTSILYNLKKGQKAIIKGFNNKNISKNFYELGIFPGMELKMLFKSYFQGPLCISYYRGKFCLMIRKSEAENILIEPIPK